ncbi:MAG: MBL fold metallo-hydrolase [Phycisphaerales bacterium]
MALGAITPIDLDYLALPGAALAFLVEVPDEGVSHGSHRVLVECGPEACRPRLEAELERLGVDPASIEAVALTHIHLDHAGAVGGFTARGSRVLVHPRGVRHLIDPEKLVASSRRVHGERFDRFYGAPIPCPADQVDAFEDGQRATFGEASLRAIETPGHAKHHHAWMLEHDGGRECFTGDVAAMLVPGSTFISVPTPATDFDPEAWDASLARLEAERPDRLWLTHGGRIDDAADFLAKARRRVAEESAFLFETARSCDDSEAIERYRAWLHPQADAAGVPEAMRSAFLGRAFLEMNLAGVRKLMRDRGSA